MISSRAALELDVLGDLAQRHLAQRLEVLDRKKPFSAAGTRAGG